MSGESEILASMYDRQIRTLANGMAAIQGLPAPYPELTTEAIQRKIESDRKTYMYGHGVSFRDEREKEAFWEGRRLP